MRRINRRFVSILLAVCLCMPGCAQRPEQQPQTASFLFFSDTQADPETGDYAGLANFLPQAIGQAGKPDMILFGGDTVNDGGDAAEWQAFWEAAEGPLSEITVAAVPGNHDNYPLLAEQFDYPEQAPAGRGESYFYSLDKGPVHFIMLDSNIMGAANQTDIDWLERDLQSEGARMAVWRIAVMHHPMWPVTDNPKDAARAQTMRAHFLPVMETYGVDLIVCGHQHIYARSRSMSGDAVSPDGGGIVQLMAASGDKQSYEPGDFDWMAASAGAPNYLVITADGATLSATAYDGDGQPFDTVILKR